MSSLPSRLSHSQESKQTEAWIEVASHPCPGDDFTDLHDHRYTAEDLSLLLTRNANIPIWNRISPEQKAELLKGLPPQDGLPSTRSQEKDKKLIDFLYFWKDLLDKDFFFGALFGKITVNLVTDAGQLGYIGYFVSETRQVDIVVNPIRLIHGCEWERYVEVLAHELLRAFLSIHTCEYEQCRAIEQDGPEGHGSAWAVRWLLSEMPWKGLGLEHGNRCHKLCHCGDDGDWLATIGQAVKAMRAPGPSILQHLHRSR